MLLFTPGHTPGHQALFVNLPKTGAVILSGDLYHFSEELTLKPTPRGRNAEQTTASMAKIQALIAKTDAQLWIQHDSPSFAKLKKSPAYLRLNQAHAIGLRAAGYGLQPLPACGRVS